MSIQQQLFNLDQHDLQVEIDDGPICPSNWGRSNRTATRASGNDLDRPTAERIQEKAEATSIATAALHGVAVRRTTNENGQVVYMASMGSWTREIAGLQGLIDWVSRVHGRRVEVAP